MPAVTSIKFTTVGLLIFTPEPLSSDQTPPASGAVSIDSKSNIDPSLQTDTELLTPAYGSSPIVTVAVANASSH